MTRKQIDASREARLWIVQIALPMITMVTTVLSIPEVRQAVAAKANEVKYKIKNRLNKTEAQ